MYSSLKRVSLIAMALSVVATACDDDPVEPVDNDVAAITGLAASATTETSVTLSWTASPDAANYTVQRQPVGGAFSEIASGVADVTYTDTGLTSGTVYNYRVIAVDSDGNASDPSDPISVTTAGARRVDLVGNITGTRTLSADTVYVLKGVVQVQDGAVLNVPAGTVVVGDKATQGALLVLRGGMLNATGTVTDPVIFTSSAAEGSRQKGDWGGVILNGRSNCNFPAGQCLGEGNTGVFGGTEPGDNSGTLTYVRIEWGGIEFSPDNELNGLTLNGVGSGTTLHHIQSHGGLDDGIEWFGGTVDLKYAIVTLASDDSFDWSTGWQGRGQFWIVQQDPEDGDEGWEIDNNEGDFEALPRTFAQIYNFTMIGRPGAAGAGSDHGILFRRGYSGNHSCGIVMGFGEAGLDIDDAATERLANNDSLTLTETTFFDNGRDLAGWATPGINFDPDEDAQAGVTNFEETWATVAAKNNTQEDPMLTDPFNRADPDFSPMAGSPVLGGCTTVPDDGFFDVVDYRGAVADANDTWYQGWITTEPPAGG